MIRWWASRDRDRETPALSRCLAPVLRRKLLRRTSRCSSPAGCDGCAAGIVFCRSTAKSRCVALTDTAPYAQTTASTAHGLYSALSSSRSQFTALKTSDVRLNIAAEILVIPRQDLRQWGESCGNNKKQIDEKCLWNCSQFKATAEEKAKSLRSRCK